jgi:hypothetical protein
VVFLSAVAAAGDALKAELKPDELASFGCDFLTAAAVKPGTVEPVLPKPSSLKGEAPKVGPAAFSNAPKLADEVLKADPVNFLCCSVNSADLSTFGTVNMEGKLPKLGAASEEADFSPLGLKAAKSGFVSIFLGSFDC